MRVEVFFVPDCPHHPAAVQRVRDVLLAEGIRAEIHETAITDANAAQELRFRGSPTIRINGRDIAGESIEKGSYALACRLYPGSKEPGVPPVEMIRRAVRDALDGDQQ